MRPSQSQREWNRVRTPPVGAGHRGPTLTAKEFATEVGVSNSTMSVRLNEDGEPEPVVTVRTNNRRYYAALDLRLWWKNRQ